MGIELDVIKAVLEPIEIAISGLTIMPLKMPGRVFVPPDDQKYIEIVRLANDFDNTWGEEKVFQGIVRIIVHWPIDDEGVYGPVSLCESIVDLFPKGFRLRRSLASLQITENPRILDPIENGPEYLYPVTFPYRS